uniref:Uncharacterized protein n=1 Tax=Amphimedon queenslandica TaxID=400682 RepID=A0A1X7TEH6_AMPQE
MIFKIVFIGGKKEKEKKSEDLIKQVKESDKKYKNLKCHSKFQTDHSKLQTDHIKLKNDYSKLRDKRNQLQIDNNRLMRDMDKINDKLHGYEAEERRRLKRQRQEEKLEEEINIKRQVRIEEIERAKVRDEMVNNLY